MPFSVAFVCSKKLNRIDPKQCAHAMICRQARRDPEVIRFHFTHS